MHPLTHIKEGEPAFRIALISQMKRGGELMSAKRIVSGVLPPFAKKLIRYGEFRLRVPMMFGHLAPLVPPKSLMHDGPPTYEEFKANAEWSFRTYRDFAKLRPDDKVLDVGCGIGRKTIKLTEYISGDGAYDGIDIFQSGIDWCSRKITPRFPNFRFQVADVYNEHYNPQGKTQACDYHFPFEDKAFDFVTLGSVFTHMLPADVENYLGEIRRVLKDSGRCLISWFLIDSESEALISEGRSTLNLVRGVENVCRSLPPPADRESAIGFQELYVRDLYRMHGFREPVTIRHGSWCGRPGDDTYQDLILAYVN